MTPNTPKPMFVANFHQELVGPLYFQISTNDTWAWDRPNLDQAWASAWSRLSPEGRLGGGGGWGTQNPYGNVLTTPLTLLAHSAIPCKAWAARMDALSQSQLLRYSGTRFAHLLT